MIRCPAVPILTCMDTDPTPDSAATGSPRWFKGCAMALLVLTVLVLLGAAALAEVEKGLDGYGHLDNGTDEVLHPGGPSLKTSVSTIADAPLVVRPGKSLDDYASGYDLTWLNEDEAASVLMPPLGKEKKRTVLVRVEPGKQGTPVTVEVAPPSAGYRETAYWQLDLA